MCVFFSQAPLCTSQIRACAPFAARAGAGANAARGRIVEKQDVKSRHPETDSNSVVIGWVCAHSMKCLRLWCQCHTHEQHRLRIMHLLCFRIPGGTWLGDTVRIERLPDSDSKEPEREPVLQGPSPSPAWDPDENPVRDAVHRIISTWSAWPDSLSDNISAGGLALRVASCITQRLRESVRDIEGSPPSVVPLSLLRDYPSISNTTPTNTPITTLSLLRDYIHDLTPRPSIGSLCSCCGDAGGMVVLKEPLLSLVNPLMPSRVRCYRCGTSGGDMRVCTTCPAEVRGVSCCAAGGGSCTTDRVMSFHSGLCMSCRRHPCVHPGTAFCRSCQGISTSSQLPGRLMSMMQFPADGSRRSDEAVIRRATSGGAFDRMYRAAGNSPLDASADPQVPSLQLSGVVLAPPIGVGDVLWVPAGGFSSGLEAGRRYGKAICVGFGADGAERATVEVVLLETAGGGGATSVGEAQEFPLSEVAVCKTFAEGQRRRNIAGERDPRNQILYELAALRHRALFRHAPDLTANTAHSAALVLQRCVVDYTARMYGLADELWNNSHGLEQKTIRSHETSILHMVRAAHVHVVPLNAGEEAAVFDPRETFFPPGAVVVLGPGICITSGQAHHAFGAGQTFYGDRMAPNLDFSLTANTLDLFIVCAAALDGLANPAAPRLIMGAAGGVPYRWDGVAPATLAAPVVGDVVGVTQLRGLHSDDPQRVPTGKVGRAPRGTTGTVLAVRRGGFVLAMMSGTCKWTAIAHRQHVFRLERRLVRAAGQKGRKWKREAAERRSKRWVREGCRPSGPVASVAAYLPLDMSSGDTEALHVSVFPCEESAAAFPRRAGEHERVIIPAVLLPVGRAVLDSLHQLQRMATQVHEDMGTGTYESLPTTSIGGRVRQIELHAINNALVSLCMNLLRLSAYVGFVRLVEVPGQVSYRLETDPESGDITVPYTDRLALHVDAMPLEGVGGTTYVPHLVYNRLADTVRPLNAALDAAHADYLIQLESLRMVVAIRKAEGDITFAVTHELRRQEVEYTHATSGRAVPSAGTAALEPRALLLIQEALHSANDDPMLRARPPMLDEHVPYRDPDAPVSPGCLLHANPLSDLASVVPGDKVNQLDQAVVWWLVSELGRGVDHAEAVHAASAYLQGLWVAEICAPTWPNTRLPPEVKEQVRGFLTYEEQAALPRSTAVGRLLPRTLLRQPKDPLEEQARRMFEGQSMREATDSIVAAFVRRCQGARLLLRVTAALGGRFLLRRRWDRWARGVARRRAKGERNVKRKRVKREARTRRRQFLEVNTDALVSDIYG